MGREVFLFSMTNVTNVSRESFGQASSELLPIRKRVFLYESRRHLPTLDHLIPTLLVTIPNVKRACGVHKGRRSPGLSFSHLMDRIVILLPQLPRLGRAGPEARL